MIRICNFPVFPTKFPDGTSQVWNLPAWVAEGNPKILWKFEEEAEIVWLAQLAYWLRKLGKIRNTTLFMPTMPYARQDHELTENGDTTSAVFPFLRMLSEFEFHKIIVVDPHCENLLRKEPNLLGRSQLEIVSPLGFIRYAIRECHPDVICFPDAGARRRYEDLFLDNDWYLKPYGNHEQLSIIHLRKERNQQTGDIAFIEVDNTPLPYEGAKPQEYIKGTSILIVDDLCDGGATFCRGAKVLYDFGAKEVNLYVTHGLFTKGTTPLREAGIKRIFTQYGETV